VHYSPENVAATRRQRDVHTSLGEKVEAFQALERAIELRAPFVTLIKVDPRFDSLRADPRFQKLLGQMNFPQ
jgi:hypothetical protein